MQKNIQRDTQLLNSGKCSKKVTDKKTKTLNFVQNFAKNCEKNLI